MDTEDPSKEQELISAVHHPTGGAEPEDVGLDANTASDVQYLESLGYRQVLVRRLGAFASFGVLFSIIGVSVSIYTLFGYGLTTAGPFAIWPFIIGGALQLVVGLSIAELVSAYPIAGGAYQIVNRIWGGVIAWQTGWLLMIALVVSMATNATAIATYFGSQVGLNSLTHGQTLLIAFIVLLLITMVNVVGVRYSALVNNIGITCEIVGLALIVVLLLVKGVIQPVSFLGNKGGIHGSFLLPFLYAFLFPVYMINAFDSTGHTGEETVDAARQAPKAAVAANASAYIYAVIALIVVTLSIEHLGPVTASATPVTDIVSARLGKFYGDFLTVIVIVSFVVASLMLQLTAARIFWAQARDRKMPFPRFLEHLNRASSPANATVVAGIIAFAFCLFSSVLSVLAAMVALAFSVANVITVAAGVWAKATGRLPKHPWNYGFRVGLVFDTISIIWSAGIAVILLGQNLSQVGKGFLYVLVAGFLIYYIGVPKRYRTTTGVSDT